MTTLEQPLAALRAFVAHSGGDAQRHGLSVDGEGGLLAQLTKLVLESALEGELTAHLGYDKHERVEGGVNARNGTRSKTVLTKAWVGTVLVDGEHGLLEPGPASVLTLLGTPVITAGAQRRAVLRPSHANVERGNYVRASGVCPVRF